MHLSCAYAKQAAARDWHPGSALSGRAPEKQWQLATRPAIIGGSAAGRKIAAATGVAWKRQRWNWLHAQISQPGCRSTFASSARAGAWKKEAGEGTSGPRTSRLVAGSVNSLSPALACPWHRRSRAVGTLATTCATKTTPMSLRVPLPNFDPCPRLCSGRKARAPGPWRGEFAGESWAGPVAPGSGEGSW